MSIDWFDKEEEAIDRDFEDGVIDAKERSRALRELRWAAEAAADEAADRAREDFLSGY